MILTGFGSGKMRFSVVVGSLAALVSAVTGADDLFNDDTCRSRTLTEGNFDGFVEDAISKGQTAFVRFIGMSIPMHF